MNKGLFLTSAFVIFALIASVNVQALVPHATAADGNMAQVQLIIEKLRSSTANMKDFDDLEAAGMDKSDVDRLRNAMNRKIKQMTSDVVDLIRVL